MLLFKADIAPIVASILKIQHITAAISNVISNSLKYVDIDVRARVFKRQRFTIKSINRTIKTIMNIIWNDKIR